MIFLIFVLIRTSNDLLVHKDKVEKSEGPICAIEEWPTYIRLLLLILFISIDRKREKKMWVKSKHSYS